MAKNKEDDTNYSFLLKCMAALTAAAIVTAGVIAAVTLKSAAATTTAIAAKTLLTSVLMFAPAVFPIAFVAIGLVFVLPFLFSCNNNTYTTVRTTTTPGYRGYGNYSFYSPAYDDTPNPYYGASTVYVGSDHSHGHPSTQGTVQVHDSAHSHGHDSGHNRHGHF
ncbi:Uncharacterised protein [Legionella steigerwaltii]|uniref:Transmembrane protein n=1 Tax=Legionella steigerwaltii TaxID=460 RepID=A0A378L7P5_9GAMM|nr:hypothetical protein [Legionella steigerwaltii]KTD77536.1 hypothetical protein Lstg_1893 [Legionella steigerwaltii]STY22846.1 Uncharacterised protein [Legionella steigerwaltii]